MHKVISEEKIISDLKKSFDNDRFRFDLQCSMYLAGDHHKRLRQQIIKTVTGQTRPITKCGLHSVSDVLISKFQQPELF